MNDDVVDEWLVGGQNAIALVTSSMQYPDAVDPAYIAEARQLVTGMSVDELAIVTVWLARMAGQAVIDKHDGCYEGAKTELQSLGLDVLCARQATGAGLDVGD